MTKAFTVEQLRCLELARIIREGLEGVRFDMCEYRSACGTAGCIGGYAIARYEPAIWQHGHELGYRNIAKKLLGLKENAVEQMFAPWYFDGPAPNDITPAMAATTLENYALTGKVEWGKP